jgi:hypothetical protein
MLVLADKALVVTIVSIFIWFIFFPLLVNGLVVYAVIQGRGEKRANEELRRRRESKPARSPSLPVSARRPRPRCPAPGSRRRI